MTDDERSWLQAYSRAEMTAIDLRRRLGGATYGDVILLLREAGLPLPQASVDGREADIARARSWLLPKNGA